MKYSIIIPIYNRPDEAHELLESLSKQSVQDFEIIMVEDGSSHPCKHIVEMYAKQFNIQYFFKTNSGPGDSRNFGMQKAKGDYLIFFDSDCLIPEHYFKEVNAFLSQNPLDCFGGPDAAHPSFSIVQKAINYAMTARLTTGGIRGKKNTIDTYQPRSFNMGFTQEVYQKIGGFSDIHPGEDPDLSYRIMQAGFRVGLIEKAHVYHKRRIDFKKFAKQVYKFGVVRIILMKWYPKHKKLTYFLPSTFLLGNLFLMLLSIFYSFWFLIPIIVFAMISFADAFYQTKHTSIAFYAVLASFIQFFAYGYGFLKSYLLIKILKRDPRKALPEFFFLAK